MAKRSSGTGKALFEPPFLVACVILGAAVFGISSTTGPKEPLPLRRPLGEFDKTNLGPYRFEAPRILPAAVEAELGATDYIDWLFRDTSIKNKRDPLARVRLFVSYYTGGRDRVPHTADQCVVAAGYESVKGENIDVEIDALGRTIPLRAVTFRKSAIFGNEELTVVYTFQSNGDFACTRTGVRYRVNSPDDRFAYYCKIEVSFGSPNSRPRNATREDTIEAATRFLNYVLPPLLENHLPDWEAATRAGPVAAAGAL